ncbi:MAG: glycosyltransferase family 4 protein, partial [Anaerolineae bacterium]|nr:glycosyltransferase family 4 protein [Anaerolineae bacterium]
TLPKKGNFTYRVVEGTLPVLGMPIREQIGLPKHIAQDHIDVMHFPCLTATLKSRCPFVLTLHDTIWLTSRPGSLSSQEGRSPKRRAMWLYNRWVPQWATRRAQHIIAVSHATKADIVNQLGIPPEDISVVHNVIKAIFRPNRSETLPETIRRRYGLDEEFILGIGSADPRKNIVGLVSAYARLPSEQRARYQLRIVWTHSFLQHELLILIDQLGVRGRVRFLECVLDEDLAMLYNAATLFVFPSHYEGFGLPPLEAMACGTPVIAANNSSIPEVVGDAGLLVDSTDFDALATAMERALADAVLRAKLSRKGLERARQFSWERFGKETLKVYERSLS